MLNFTALSDTEQGEFDGAGARKPAADAVEKDPRTLI
jgi:hypothetical protein